MDHLNLLGKRAQDKVTGYTGVITSISYDLYGCIQAVISPPVDKDGLRPDGQWFDVARLSVTGDPVMDVPDFSQGYVDEGLKGASSKTLPNY